MSSWQSGEVLVPVFSCLSNAVLLPPPHPRGKDPFLPVISRRWHYLHSVSADAMQNDSPKSSVPLPDNSAGGAHKAENTKSHSGNTLGGDSLCLSSLEMCCSRNNLGLCCSSGCASLLEKTPWLRLLRRTKETPKTEWKPKMPEGCERGYCHIKSSFCLILNGC